MLSWNSRKVALNGNSKVMSFRLIKCLISHQSESIKTPAPSKSRSLSKLKGASMSSSVVLAIRFKCSALAEHV